MGGGPLSISLSTLRTPPWTIFLSTNCSVSYVIFIFIVFPLYVDFDFHVFRVIYCIYSCCIVFRMIVK